MCLEPSLRAGGWWEKKGNMDLTVEDIKNDILSFQERISVAQTKLNILPTGYLPRPEYKKLEKQRRDLQGEIFHIENLIKYAREGIVILESEDRHSQGELI